MARRLLKDFTTVLSMHREKRAKILAQLREIHDGMFKRNFGTDETKIWKGRITIIAAVTPVLDRHISIFAALGERFLQTFNTANGINHRGSVAGASLLSGGTSGRALRKVQARRHFAAGQTIVL